MVETARATHRQSLKGLADDINLVIQNIQLVHLNIHRRMDLLAQPVKTRSEDGLIQPRGWIDSWMRKLIPSKMFHDELIIWKVLVNGANDVIPIAPGFGDRVVKFMPHGLRIAHQIQPVTRPMLSIVNGTQQRFDDLLLAFPLSCRNAFNAAWVGGRPVRTTCTRLNQAAEETADAGRSPPPRDDASRRHLSAA